MIALRHVRKSYGNGPARKLVLDDLSALFDLGADVGILGANASGKSTLLRIIGGMERPDSGTVLRRCRVSYPVGFAGGFHPAMSGRDNVRFIARLYGASAEAVVRYVRDFIEIGAQFDQPLLTYSNNMRARLTFATSLALEFDVYLVDEVTAVGDIAFKRKCMLAFAERRRNARIIMVSQAATTIGKLCQRGAILEDGRLRLFDTMADAIAAFEHSLPMVNHV